MENLKTLLAAIKSSAMFTSQDPVRPQLCGMNLVYKKDSKDLTLESTNGHCAMRITLHNVFNAKCDRDGDLFLPTSVLKLATAQAETAPTFDLWFGGLPLNGVKDGVRFPDLSYVYRYDGSKKAGSKVGVDPSYMADVCKAIENMRKATRTKVTGAVIQLHGDLDPIHVTFSDNVGTVSVAAVIMPMRM